MRPPFRLPRPDFGAPELLAPSPERCAESLLFANGLDVLVSGRPRFDDRGRGGELVPDLAKYECPESDDEYRHRMTVNAAAAAFTSVLILAGVWLANMIAHV
jgi:hypothetical protein